jgi:hypothetical protein
VEIDPDNPSEALEIAHGCGLRQGSPASIVVSELPESVFQDFLGTGAVSLENVPGLGTQTVFLPDAFADFNLYSTRYYFTPGG